MPRHLVSECERSSRQWSIQVQSNLFSAGGKHVDASQEMIALGLCNFAASFFQAYPTTGSFSRTAVNNASGVKTTAGGVFTGLIVILALVVLMPACAFIPKATLAAVIITAVIFSVEFEYIMPMLRSKSKHAVRVLVTDTHPLARCPFQRRISSAPSSPSAAASSGRWSGASWWGWACTSSSSCGTRPTPT